jgi:hypothetical protein
MDPFNSTVYIKYILYILEPLKADWSAPTVNFAKSHPLSQYQGAGPCINAVVG